MLYMYMQVYVGRWGGDVCMWGGGVVMGVCGEVGW